MVESTESPKKPHNCRDFWTSMGRSSIDRRIPSKFTVYLWHTGGFDVFHVNSPLVRTVTTKNKAAGPGALKSAENRLQSGCVAVFTGFCNMQGKLHGLPKKVLKFSVNIAYCQIV